jgi:hypothetical protein
MTLSRIAEVTQDQWGLITRRQATLPGVPQTTMEPLTAPGWMLYRVAYLCTGCRAQSQAASQVYSQQ